MMLKHKSKKDNLNKKTIIRKVDNTLRIHSMRQTLKNSQLTKLNVLTSRLPIGKGKQEIYLKRNSVSGQARDSSHPDGADSALI